MAIRQLSLVFASNGLEQSEKVQALKEPAWWGPSGHWRVETEISSRLNYRGDRHPSAQLFNSR